MKEMLVSDDDVRVISIAEVIEALEGEFDGQRVAGVMHRVSRYGGRTGYCCLGVMGKLAGLEDEVMVEKGLPFLMSVEAYERFREAFPWVADRSGPAASRCWQELSHANDAMGIGDRSYAGPLAVLRGWADED